MNADEEERLLRSVAMQNAQSILAARQRAEEELIRAKQALELRTAELAHSLSLTRATLESTTDGILVTDESGRITDFNRRYMLMWGIDDEVMAAGDRDAILDITAARLHEPAAYRARIDEIVRASAAETFDLLELADGTIFERASRTRMVDGQQVGRVWSFRDITARRRAEEALRDESRVLEILHGTGIALSSRLDLQELLQAVTDAATQLTGAQFGAFFYNAAGGADGDTLLLYTLSGAPRAAFDGLGHPRATELFGPTFRGEPPIRIADVRQDPRYAQTGIGMPLGHLSVRSYLAAPVLSGAGHVLGSLLFGHSEAGVFTERSERLVVGLAANAAVAIDNARLYEAAQKAAVEREKLLASERSARAEAERLGELKDEFLATLSHELRTPLNAILGWAQVLRRSGAGEADLHKGLDTIERNARVQTQLIEDLLDMSRITSGKVRLEVQPLRPLTFVEAAVETVRPSAESKGIRLEMMLDPLAGPVSGDPSRLQQVLWNLLSNAIKFTPKGGKVQVLLERVNSQIEISVVDTGCGIRPEFLPFVFERFRQAEATTTRRYGGLGLGLSIVKQLVELHGGSVRVKSAGQNRGSTFTVHLPLAAVHQPVYGEGRTHPRAPSATRLDFTTTDLTGLKLLVVDDEPDARELVKRVLSDCGAEVMATGSAEEALRYIESQRPDVLVSDIGMPETDGYELLRRVRALGAERGGKLPAIALTAFARSEDRTRALRAGFLAHIAKPVEPSELGAMVAAVAGRSSGS